MTCPCAELNANAKHSEDECCGVGRKMGSTTVSIQDLTLALMVTFILLYKFRNHCEYYNLDFEIMPNPLGAFTFYKEVESVFISRWRFLKLPFSFIHLPVQTFIMHVNVFWRDK